MPRLVFVLPIVAGLSMTSVQVFAQSGAPVKGTFASRGTKFQVGGGVAFTGKSSLDGQTPVILVVITNTGLNSSAIADFVDRKRAIEQLVKDDETPIVYLEFTPDGRWRGLSYYLESGNGCGFCSSDVESRVTFVNGRLMGSVRGTEKDRPFDVALDIAVLSDDHGAPLPAGGGAPGKAYLAYHAALTQRAPAALKPTLSPGNLEVFARAEKTNDLDAYLSFLAKKHPIKSVRVVGGWSSGTKASLTIEGESGVGKVVGEVLLVNTNGQWGVDEELTDLVIGN